MALKIVLVGVVDEKESTNWDQAVALQHLGHDVVGFNYRSVAQVSRNGDEAAESYKDCIRQHNPDLVIYSKFSNWPSEAIDWTRERGILTWYWYMDPLSFLSKPLMAHALASDFASATGIAQVDYMKAHGINAHHILEGVTYYHKYNSMISLAGYGEKREFDVAFIGEKTADRAYIMSRIQDRGHKVYVGGPGWDTVDKIDAYDFMRLCANSELVLGRDREKYTYGYFSDRAFRTFQCAGAYISVKPPGTEDVLRHMDNCYTAENDTELLDLIDAILEDPVEYDLEGVRDRAQTSALLEHSWVFTMKKMLDILKEDGRIPAEKFEREDYVASQKVIDVVKETIVKYDMRVR